MKKILVILAVLLVVGVVAGFFIRGEYVTEQTVERPFTIAEDFTKVRKIMVRTNAAKEIVTMGGDSEFVDQKWEGGDVDLGEKKVGEGKILDMIAGGGGWQIDLTGELQVRTTDEYIGKNEIKLQQVVKIDPDEIDSQVRLKKPGEKLLDYQMTTNLQRDEQQTKVTLKLTQKIKTEAPWWAHSIADRRVKASAAKTLENQEAAMRELIDENSDDVGLLPLK
ncbi:MAG: hypothetical protein RH917_19210 [Lacipirellulaceae bacterium]